MNSPVQITQAELWSFNILNTSAVNAQNELQRTLQAKEAYIGLLEQKYGAVFNPATNQLELIMKDGEGKQDVAEEK